MFGVMLISTVFGVLFAFCGLMGGVAFFLEAQQGMSMGSFLRGFTAATWPLMAACVLFVLQGIFKEVSALREKAEDDKNAQAPAPLRKNTAPEAPAETPAAHAAAPAPAAKPGPVYFPVRETPMGPRIVRPAEETPATAHPAAAAPLPEAPATAPAPAAPETETAPASPAPAATAEPKTDGLTFFKTR